MEYWQLLVGFVVGLLVMWFIMYSLAAKWREAIKKENLADRQFQAKEASKQKIVVALEGMDKITNDEVQKLLGVSDATATRYLGELEKQGIVRQIGITGQAVYYEKI